MRPHHLLLLGLVACQDAPPEPSSRSILVAAPSVEAVRVDVEAALRDPAALVRALTLRHRDLVAGLGAHRVRGSSRVRLSEGDVELLAFEETAEIDVAASGDFRAVYRNSKDYGREVYRAGEHLYLRPLYGRYHRRLPVAPDEPARILDEIAGTFAADVELTAAALAVVGAAEDVAVAGRPARRVRLVAGPPRAAPAPATPERAWRGSVVVDALTGSAALDPGGALLAGELTAQLHFAREGRTLRLELAARVEVSDVGAAVAVTPPPAAETLDTPGVSSESDDRQDLLEGIAAPRRRK